MVNSEILDASKRMANPLSVEYAPGTEKHACSPGAICFSGGVAQGGEIREALNTKLEFVLQPGWEIAIVPQQPQGDCKEFASVVNGPYRAHRDLLIDTSYGWTAEDEVTIDTRDEKLGKIQWMRFSVEILLPAAQAHTTLILTPTMIQ